MPTIDALERINSIGGPWALLAFSGWAVSLLLWKHHISFLKEYNDFVKEVVSLMTRVESKLDRSNDR